MYFWLIVKPRGSTSTALPAQPFVDLPRAAFYHALQRSDFFIVPCH